MSNTNNPITSSSSTDLRGLRQTLIAFGVMAAIVTLTACGAGDKAYEKEKTAVQKVEAKDGEHADKDGIKLSPEEIQRAGIKVETLKAQVLKDSIHVTATIRPDQERIARVAPRVEGRVTATPAKLGDVVQAGQTLAILDSLTLGEASSALIQAQSTHRLAEADFKRAESLNADEIIPRREYLRAKSDYEKSNATLRAAQDKLRLLGVSSKLSGRVESTFPLVAPFAGTVIEKNATLGQLANPSEPLFVLADLSKVWIEANLNESQIAKVRPGADATVSVAAYPGERFAGRVTYVASMLDKASRTIPARIEVDNKDGRLKPEMFATATIDTNGTSWAQKGVALTVPDEAIVLLLGQPTVFVFEHGGFEARAIAPGEKFEGRTVITSGLTEGDQIVASGAYALKARLLKSQISDEH